MRTIVGGILAGACVLTGASAVQAFDAPPERRAAVTPVVDLDPGRGDARVAITPNGKHAIVHQGSSYDPDVLLKVALSSTPPRVVGRVPVPADTDSRLALVGGKFAYTLHGDELWVTDIRRSVPRKVRKVRFKVKGDRATLFDVAVTPNGRFAYVTAKNWIHEPGSTVLVLRVKKNGVPKLVRRQPVKATHLAVSRDGKRLLAAAGSKVHRFDIRKPTRLRKTGKAIKVAGDVRDVAFGAKANIAYVLSSGDSFAVSRVNTKRGRVSHRSVLVSNGSSLFNGGLAVSANGRRVLVTSDQSDGTQASVAVHNDQLQLLSTQAGPCYADAAAASLAGPTRGRFYVSDSGICGQARLWQVTP